MWLTELKMLYMEIGMKYKALLAIGYTWTIRKLPKGSNLCRQVSPAGTWRQYNVASTSMQRWLCIDVEPTLYDHHVLAGDTPSMTLIQRRLNVDATLWRCIDVEPTLYDRHVPAGSQYLNSFKDGVIVKRKHLLP